MPEQDEYTEESYDWKISMQTMSQIDYVYGKVKVVGRKRESYGNPFVLGNSNPLINSIFYTVSLMTVRYTSRQQI